MNLIIAVVLFICVLCLIEGLFLMVWTRQNPVAKKVRRQLKALSMEPSGDQVASIVRRIRPLSSIPRLNRILSGMPLMLKIDRFFLRANSRQPLGVFLLLSLLLAGCGFYVTSLLTGDTLPALPAAIIMGGIPFFRLFMQKKRRLKKFQAQLPDALELMARSLRAGHAFVGGLQMVAQEFDDPMGLEISKTIAQINFGISVEQALKNLTERVDCQDLKFVTVSIIIQRESGGDLAEVLESVGSLIRARFKLAGQIRTLSAEGKISGVILAGLPIAIALTLAFINPEYLAALWTDPAGKMLVLVALAMMAVGTVVMKKMIAIKV